MISFIIAAALGAAPAAEISVPGGSIWGTERLHVERDDSTAVFDFRDQVHLEMEDPAEVVLRLTSIAASDNLDRVASAWMVLAEDGSDGAALSAWIGILEPARGRLAGFPVQRRPHTLALSADGEVVAWSDAAGVYVMPLTAPPRPKLVLPRDIDPPLFDVEPLLFDNLDLLDLALDFGAPDISFEIFDLVDLAVEIDEEDDDWDVEAPSPPPPPGAQLLVSPITQLPNPLGSPATLVSLSYRGRHLAAAAGDRVALWSAGATEPTWTGALDGTVTGLSWDGDQASATLASGKVVALPAKQPVASSTPR